MIEIGKYKAVLENSGANTGSFNMGYDLKLLEKVRESEIPIFRTYFWNPWAISLGKNQKSDGFDLAKLSRDGYDIVTRPTGGRAVFHGNELTYSFICKLQDVSHHDIYRDIHLFFEKVFNDLGIKSDFAKGDIKLSDFYNNKLSASCFASSARYELTINNKKVVGSAQRVIDGFLLQHGSIPIDDSYLKIADYQKGIEPDKIRSFLSKISTSVNENIKGNIAYDDILNVINRYDL
ncbi:lipoate--protein ligase family protein [Candidatus Kapabacteria bacterium]|nr:lipoate--protein ligase family protein [Candidatus Kapabacteria bacterium]